MSDYCMRFSCRYEENRICSITGDKCTDLYPSDIISCSGFFGKCDSCASTTCKFISAVPCHKEAFSRPTESQAPSVAASMPEQNTFVSESAPDMTEFEQEPSELDFCFGSPYKKCYAVKKGRKIGIFNSWEECKKSVDGYSGAVYKSFRSQDEAENFLTGSTKGNTTIDASTPYAYVDGSFYNGVYGYGGFVVDKEGRHILQGSGSEPGLVSMRNVSGEILGAMAAITYAMDHHYTDLVIYYDYEGIEQWATGGWNANKAGTRAYKEFCKQCAVNLIFKKVKAHSGIECNELADKLAKQAVGLI